MKNNLLKNTIIVGTLCTVLVIPSFAQETKIQPVSTEDIVAIPISYKLNHWSESYIDQLSKNYDVESVFKNKDLNSDIKVEDFQNLIKLTIDKEYDKASDTMTREAIVHELTQIWAQKTGKDLDQIPTIKKIIYPDTQEINSKYNHSVTVAYMKEIAKGRDTGVFDPKANVTYGEAATLIVNVEKAIENELEANNPIAKGKFETKADYEIKDDKVIFNFELMSHYTESKELQFGSGQQFELVVTDEKGEEVYRYSDNKAFTEALVLKTLKPGESIKWQDEWNKTNKEGKKLTTGKYTAEIKVMVIEDSDEKIDENQLKSKIEFNL